MNSKKQPDNYYTYTMLFYKPPLCDSVYGKEFYMEKLKLVRKDNFRHCTFRSDNGLEFIGRIGWKVEEDSGMYCVQLTISIPTYMDKFKRLAVDKLAVYLMKKLEDKKNG